MKKTPVWIFIIVITGIFIFLGGYIINSIFLQKTPSVDNNTKQSTVLKASYFNGSIKPDELNSSFWENVIPLKINLNFQVLYIPWGKSQKGPISVRAIHNRKEIYFLLEWNDETKDKNTIKGETFADAVAIMFPLSQSQPSSLMMGFLGMVNIWHWKADWDNEYWSKPKALKNEYKNAVVDYYPFEKEDIFYPGLAVGNLMSKIKRPSAVENLIADRPGSITTKENQIVKGKGVWNGKGWRVLIMRALKTPLKDDFQFILGEKTKIAFAVWDGSKQEKGSRKSISDWVELILDE